MIQVHGNSFDNKLLEFAEAVHNQQIIIRPWHSHPNLEIHYVLSGVVTYQFKNRNETSTVKGGNFIVIAPEEKHHVVDNFAIPSMRLTMRWFYPHERKRITLSPFTAEELCDMLSEITSESQKIHTMSKQQEATASRMFRLTSGTGTREERRLTSWSLLFETAAACRSERKEPGHSDLVKTAIDLMTAKCNEKISLEWLAKASGCSRRNLFLAFQKETGVSPWRFLTRMRINLAKQMIREKPNSSLSQIALDCGFSSASHFAAVFRKYVGASPSDFSENGHGSNASNFAISFGPRVE